MPQWLISVGILFTILWSLTNLLLLAACFTSWRDEYCYGSERDRLGYRSLVITAVLSSMLNAFVWWWIL